MTLLCFLTDFVDDNIKADHPDYLYDMLDLAIESADYAQIASELLEANVKRGLTQTLTPAEARQMNTTTTKEFFAIEKSGFRHQVWGPYPSLQAGEAHGGRPLLCRSRRRAGGWPDAQPE